MTIIGALAALKAAGKIENAWLPGMRVRSLRLADRGDDEPWVRAVRGLSVLSWHIEGVWGSHAAMGPVLDEPDLTDAATVGCLLALLREAHEDSGVWVGPSHPEAWAVFVCHADGWEESGAFGETDGEAIAAALIALAGAA